MKKQLLSLATLMCMFLATTAQTNKNQLSVTIGGSTPIGSYAETGGNVNETGYAKIGANFRISYQYNFNETWGAIAIIHSTSNPVDGVEIAKTLAANAGTGFTVQNTNWTLFGSQLGPVFMKKISDRIVFEARTTIGLNSVTSPQIKGTIGNGEYVERSEASALAFVYSIGAGIKINLTERLFIPIHIDYLGGKANIKDADLVDTFNGTTQRGKTDVTMQLNNINSAIGIGFSF